LAASVAGSAAAGTSGFIRVYAVDVAVSRAVKIKPGESVPGLAISVAEIINESDCSATYLNVTVPAVVVSALIVNAVPFVEDAVIGPEIVA
jgi:hypothetical protein